MPMSLRQTTRRNQRELFEDNKTWPHWESLPPETRQAASKLLTQLFVDHLAHRAVSAAPSEEVADE
jgi:hypothetical protein